jgi:proteic killer suppression protein
VIQSFGDVATADLFHGADSKAARKMASKALWPAIRRRLDALDAATSLRDLSVLPGNRLERLRGDQEGRHSIRVNDQYRLTFRFEGGDAFDVRCEDYH